MNEVTLIQPEVVWGSRSQKFLRPHTLAARIRLNRSATKEARISRLNASQLNAVQCEVAGQAAVPFLMPRIMPKCKRSEPETAVRTAVWNIKHHSQDDLLVDVAALRKMDFGGVAIRRVLKVALATMVLIGIE